MGRRDARAFEPRGLPLVGHAPAFLRDRLGFLTKCASRSSGVVELRIGGPTFLLTEPADVEHVLLTNHAAYVKTPRLTQRRNVFGHGVMTSLGSDHREKRRAVQPAFQRRTLPGLAEAVTATTDEVLAQWRSGTEVDAGEQMMRLARRAVLRAIFGVETAEIEGLDAHVAARQVWIESLFQSLVPFPEHAPLPVTRRGRAASLRLEAAIRTALRARRERGDPSDDLLSLLLATRSSDGGLLGDDALVDEAMTVTVTGHETLGAALAWALYLLAGNPITAERLHRESRETLDDRSPSAADLASLPYAAMVFAESLRLYPPTWIFVRVAVVADRLPSGFRIPDGAKLYLCPWVIHRDLRWFPEPDRFDPERFSVEAIRSRPDYAYFPFGGGARLCMGKPFAEMEGVLVLTRIVQRFELALAPRQRVIPKPGIVLSPRDGVRLVPRAR